MREKASFVCGGMRRPTWLCCSEGMVNDLDDKDTILEQVADDSTKLGMVKISVVADSGADRRALTENMMQRLPLKPCAA